MYIFLRNRVGILSIAQRVTEFNSIKVPHVIFIMNICNTGVNSCVEVEMSDT